MEERQPAGVLGHEDEARRADGGRDIEACSETLCEDGLAGAELTPQAQDVTRFGGAGKAPAELEGDSRGRRAELAFEIGRRGHSPERSRRGSLRRWVSRRGGSRVAFEVADRDPGPAVRPEID